MEYDNDLQQRVHHLKQISIEIDNELQYQKQLMNEMDSSFSINFDMLNNAMAKVKHLIRTENGGWMWLMLLFVIGTLSFLYFRF
jgi:hypothetical protein